LNSKNTSRITDQPDRCEETALFSEGYHRIAGIDEAGRGALAGPVVAAAVVLHQDAHFDWFDLVKDSKLLRSSVREDLLNLMRKCNIEIGIGIVSPAIIDSINILNATKKAMMIAIQQLSSSPDYVLTDAVCLPKLSIPQKNIIKGDRTCLTISCASVAAKVTRDHIMIKLDARHPEYGFNNHKGYGTVQHIDSLRRFGATKVHRFTFGPVRDLARML